MAQELINVLNKIHRELIISNMETPRLKQMQREVFALEDEYKIFEKRAEELSTKVDKWLEENAQDEEGSLDAFLKEHNPILAAAEKRTDERLTKIHEELESYKGYGLVTEYE